MTFGRAGASRSSLVFAPAARCWLPTVAVTRFTRSEEARERSERMAMALGLIGGIASGVMGMAQANYQGQVAEMNAEIAKDNAKRAVERSQIEQESQDLKAANALGAQVTEQGASGLSLSSGSMMRSRRSARRLARLDALNVRQAGRIEEYNYLTEAANQKAQAHASRISGVGSLLGWFFSGLNSLVGSSQSTGWA